VPVTTAHVVAKAVPVNIPAVGTAEAISSVQVRAQVTGQLSEVHFSEGQEVRKGQLLFTLDSRPFEAALQQAQAVLARDTATANNAKSQNARYEDLYKRGLIPRDQYETQAASTQSLQATLEADRAAVETARLNLSYTRISAPISGRTGALAVHTGDLIRANDATPLVVINQLAPIYVTFAVPGRYLNDIRRYQAQKPLEVTAQGQASVPPGAQPPAPDTTPQATAPPPNANPAAGAAEAAPTVRGTVTFIDNSVDATTGTIKLKGTFPNPDHRLWPGLFVQVTLRVATNPNALVVPAVAVQASQQGQYIYVVKPDSTVEVRPVNVERQQGDEMVIASGVSAGEEIVTDGQLRLAPGARIVRATGRGSSEDARGGAGRRGANRRNGEP
jgi:multidrug efflux system membrane fusion protein